MAQALPPGNVRPVLKHILDRASRLFQGTGQWNNRAPLGGTALLGLWVHWPLGLLFMGFRAVLMMGEVLRPEKNARVCRVWARQGGEREAVE